MPSGRSIYAPLVVAVAVLGLGACRAEPESFGQEPEARPENGGTTVAESAPIAERATASDARLVVPDGGQVKATVDRDGEFTVLFVGDSVLVSAADDLAARVDGDLVFNAADCRRLVHATSGSCGGVPPGVEVDDGLTAIAETVADLANDRVSPDVAVIVLANNSTVEPDQLDAAMDLLAGVPQVWWVNSRIDGYGRQDLNNRALEALVRRDDRAAVIDWYATSDDPVWFQDHVHPNDLGQRHFAALVDDHLECGCVP